MVGVKGMKWGRRKLRCKTVERRSLEFLRCPVCGKVSRVSNFHAETTHRDELMRCVYRGGRGKAFAWERRPISNDIAFMLYLRLQATVSRLERDYLFGIITPTGYPLMAGDMTYYPKDVVIDE